MNSIKQRIQQVQAQIREAADSCQCNPDDITLLAVSKNHDLEQIQQAFAAGCRNFGESYVQEAVAKIDQLAGYDLIWHFIGPIQSNKTQSIAKRFQWVHSVERAKIAKRLNEQRPEQLPPLNVCIQVNASGESSKSGIRFEQLPDLAVEIQQYSRLRLRGLMTIARRISSEHSGQQELKQTFARLREALQQLNSMGMSLDTLSMGMSGDLATAIQEGATIVRVGTAIFGARR